MSYDNGKIYLIGSPSFDKYYIGSTIESLDARFKNHKSHYKRWLDGTYHNCSSFELIKYGDCYIKLIENYPCNSKHDLCRREGQFHIECADFIVNKLIAGRTKAEYSKSHKAEAKLYKQAHKADTAEYNKLHYQSHKADKLEYNKLYHQSHRTQNNARRRLNRQRRKLIQSKNGNTESAICPTEPQIEDPESC